MWIKRKSEERLRIEMPKEIDGVIMEDVVLGEELEPKIRQYGGVALDEDEKAALKRHDHFFIISELKQGSKNEKSTGENHTSPLQKTVASTC